MNPPLVYRIVNSLRAWWEARGDQEGTYLQQIQVLKPEPKQAPRVVGMVPRRVGRWGSTASKHTLRESA